MNFNELLLKNVTHNNVKSHKKTGRHTRSRKYIFGKTIGEGVGQIDPASFFRVKGAL